MLDGIISDVQRASFHDGYGIRTTVFFKGCPLQCKWCHNPECISFEPQELLYPEKCIHCGECDKGCYSGARVVCGKKYSCEELFSEVISDKDYYINGGGVTFSGGEPMAQKDFLNAMINRCKENSINCAVETSLIYFDSDIFKKLDFVMADLKIWDSNLHKKYTGVNNEIIKDNFIRLNELNIPIIARTPVIGGIKQEIDKISLFLSKLKNVKRYELLPYHSLGNAKRIALGLKPDGFFSPDARYIKELEKFSFNKE